MSRSKRFDKRDFWDGSVDRKQTQKIKKKHRKVIQQQAGERDKRTVDKVIDSSDEIDD